MPKYYLSFLVVIQLFVAAISWAAVLPETQLSQAISTYNSFDKVAELAKILAINASAEDKSFLQSLDNGLLLKAKVQGSRIFFEGISPVVTLVSLKDQIHLLVGEQDIFIASKISIAKALNQIQTLLNSKQSKFNLFVPNANAAGIAAAAVSIYAAGAIIAASGCVGLVYAVGGAKDEMAHKCAAITLAWPFYLYKLFDSIKNGDQIIAGECGEKTNDYQVIKLKLKNNPSYTDRPLELRISNDGKKFFAIERLADGKIKYQDESPHWMAGDDKVKAAEFTNQLRLICVAGGTAALNRSLRETQDLRNGIKDMQFSKPPVVPIPGSATGAVN